MRKNDRQELAMYLSKKYLKREFWRLPTPIRMLMYGKIVEQIEKAKYLIAKYGVRKLEKIWERNREIGSKHKDWNNEIG